MWNEPIYLPCRHKFFKNGFDITDNIRMSTGGGLTGTVFIKLTSPWLAYWNIFECGFDFAEKFLSKDRIFYSAVSLAPSQVVKRSALDSQLFLTWFFIYFLSDYLFMFKGYNTVGQKQLWLRSVNDTGELDSVVSMTPPSFCLCEYLCEIETMCENNSSHK